MNVRTVELHNLKLFGMAKRLWAILRGKLEDQRPVQNNNELVQMDGEGSNYYFSAMII